MKRIDYNAPVVLSFFFASFLALVLSMVTRGNSNILLFSVYQAPLTNPLTLFRLFGHVLGHSSLSHFSSNMMLLLIVGPNLEEKYGSKNLGTMIGITAVVTGIIQMMFFPTILLGASGVVFMMIILASFGKISNGKIPMTLVMVVLIYLGNEIYLALFASDNISQVTHIVGGLLGMVFGFYLNASQK